MSHACCTHCRMRFTAEEATQIVSCPDCNAPMTRVEEAQDLLGFRLFDPMDLTDLAVDKPGTSTPKPRGKRS